MPTLYLISCFVANSLTLIVSFILLITASVYVSDIDYLYDAHSPLYTLSISSVVIGVLTIIFVSLLIIWTLKQYPILTAIFSCLLIIVILLAIICAIFLLINRSNLQTTLFNQTATIFNNYSHLNNALSPEGVVGRIQKSFKCCGVQGAADWKNRISNGTSTPDSCCRIMIPNCGKDALTTNNNIHHDGCAEPVRKYFENAYTTLIGMNFTLAILASAGCTITLYLRKFMKKRYDSL